MSSEIGGRLLWKCKMQAVYYWNILALLTSIQILSILFGLYPNIDCFGPAKGSLVSGD